MLKTYEQFVARVNELGFYPFYGRFIDGLPMVQDETTESQWHTGDPETDPWQWKDRAAEEKKLAFGCILGGYKGFISKSVYPLFVAANRLYDSPEEQYEAGELTGTAKQVCDLFEGGKVLSTADLRKAMGATKKSGAGKVDSALKELQKQFYLTVCGNRRKVSFEGLEYGWPANTYCKVEEWADAEWLKDTDKIGYREAREQILDLGCANGKAVDRKKLSKLLFGKG